MDRGRYTKYSTGRRIPKRQRRIALPGSFEDRGKWIRCWNCGFTVNVDRDLGDPEVDGQYQVDAVSEALSPAGSGAEPIMYIDTLDGAGTMIENGPDGDPITDSYTPRTPMVAKGCPFCGTTNL